MKDGVKKTTSILFIFGFLLFTSGCASLGTREGRTIRLSAVQFHAEDSLYRNEKVFTRHVENIVRDVSASFRPHVIIFPEYTSVFLAFCDWDAEISGSTSFQQGLARVHEKAPRIKTLNDFFFDEAPAVAERMDRIWGTLAEKYGTYIVAGTYFGRSVSGTEKGRLSNRLVVYGPSGGRVYTQDKVFLTDFETDMLELSPGSPDRCSGFSLMGEKIVFTICRDSFFDVWDKIYENADIWIGLKANGDQFDREARELFEHAVPERIRSTSVPLGITVCLTGEVLDLFWEGRSSAVLSHRDLFTYIAEATSPDTEEVINLSIPVSALED